MTDTFLLEIVTPERVFMQDQVEMIVFNSTSGEVGVMPHHADLAAAVTAEGIIVSSVFLRRRIHET